MEEMKVPIEYPDSWDIVKDWREELPFSPLRSQEYSSQCWNISISECVQDIAYLEKNPLGEEISNSEMHDWLPFLSPFFNMDKNPPAHSRGATMPEIFQYLKTFGTVFKKDYHYEQPLIGNNFTMFSMKKFHAIRTSAAQRVSIDTFRILNSGSAVPIIKNKHTAVGGLYTDYEEFVAYKYDKPLSPIPPVDETTKKPYGADHMVYIVGYGFDNGNNKSEDKTEGTECYLVKNTWKFWGLEGFGMVPVQLFESVAYPKGVHVRDSSIVVNNDYHLEDAWRKYNGQWLV